MNIKRMADEYRQCLTSTGEDARSVMDIIINNPTPDGVSKLRHNLGCWYPKLLKAIEDRKDLNDLEKARQTLLKISTRFRLPWGCNTYTDKQLSVIRPLVDTTNAYLSNFLEGLPKLIEKSLMLSVCKAGIKLKR